MNIPIIFLGTGQAIPTAKRNHSAILLNYNYENILIDCGEGTQRQFRKADINPCKLTKIFITHWHGDHILGLPGLLQTLALNKYNRVLDIYIPKGTRHFIDLIFRLFVFVGKIKYEVHEVDSGRFLDEKDFFCEAEKMKHGTQTMAYSFTEKDKLRIDKDKLKKLKIHGSVVGELQNGKDIEYNGKKIKSKDVTYLQKGKKITFIFDTALNDNMAKLAKDSDLLVCESTFLENSENGGKLAKEYNHLTAKQAAETAKKSKVKRLILTHISQRHESNPKAIIEEARKVFKNSELAEDFLSVEV